MFSSTSNSRPRCYRRGFTLIELLVVISIISLMIAILLPALGQARQMARKLQSNTQMRGLHQGMVIFSQGNEGWYPGWNQAMAASQGRSDPWYWWGSIARKWSAEVETRFALLIEGNFTAPEAMIHPAEIRQREPYDKASNPQFTYQHYSYAMLELGYPWEPDWYTFNKNSWQADMNPRTLLMSDRLTQQPADWNDPSTYYNIYSGSPGDLDIGMVFSDNHVEYSSSPWVETEYGGIKNSKDFIYGRAPNFPSDNVQTPSGKTGTSDPGNAMMVSAGLWSVYQPDEAP